MWLSGSAVCGGAQCGNRAWLPCLGKLYIPWSLKIQLSRLVATRRQSPVISLLCSVGTEPLPLLRHGNVTSRLPLLNARADANELILSFAVTSSCREGGRVVIVFKVAKGQRGSVRNASDTSSHLTRFCCGREQLPQTAAEQSVDVNAFLSSRLPKYSPAEFLPFLVVLVLCMCGPVFCLPLPIEVPLTAGSEF